MRLPRSHHPSTIITQTVTLILMIGLVQGQCPAGTTGFLCTQCPTGCDQCSDASTCTACSKGYYLSTTTCIACPNNCLQCDTPTMCINCIPGYDTFFNAAGEEECEFRWWKWFLIIFGILLGIFLISLLIYWVKEKWNEEDKEDKEVEYEMKVETTENDIKP